MSLSPESERFMAEMMETASDAPVYGEGGGGGGGGDYEVGYSMDGGIYPTSYVGWIVILSVCLLLLWIAIRAYDNYWGVLLNGWWDPPATLPNGQLSVGQRMALSEMMKRVSTHLQQWRVVHWMDRDTLLAMSQQQYDVLLPFTHAIHIGFFSPYHGNRHVLLSLGEFARLTGYQLLEGNDVIRLKDPRSKLYVNLYPYRGHQRRSGRWLVPRVNYWLGLSEMPAKVVFPIRMVSENNLPVPNQMGRYLARQLGGNRRK